MINALWYNTKRQVRKQGKMDDKWSSLKLKLYLFSSVNADPWQNQQQLPVREDKNCSSVGLPTHASGQKIGRHTYGYSRERHKPFRVLLEPWAGEAVLQAEMQWRGVGNHPLSNNKVSTKRFLRPLSSPGEDYFTKEERVRQAHQGVPGMR